MKRSAGLSKWRRSFSCRAIACAAIGLTCQAAFAPLALASTAPGSGKSTAPPAVDSSPPRQDLARANDSVPQLWTPRKAVVVDASPSLGAESLFDGDATTGFTAEKGKSAAIRLELGAARDVVGLGVHGTGRARIAIYAEDEAGARTPIGMVRDGDINLQPDHWAQLAPARPPRTSALVVQWTASSAAPASLTELALWVNGRSREALTEAAIADRLVTELPENAVAATAVPWSASVARMAPDGGPVSAKFDVKLNTDPLLGRAFLIYEVEKKAHWTGVSRSINGHVARGGYRADAKGLGGVQVEEVNPAWLHSGDNTILFQPTLAEDLRGYSIHNVRVVTIPRGSEPVPAPGERSPLSDGDLSTGIGGPEAKTASLSVRADREPAFLSFYLDQPTSGTLTLSGDGGWSRRKGLVNVDLAGRTAGWQTVPVAGALPTGTGELHAGVMGGKESTGKVREARVLWFPALTSQAGLTMSYPLHGECVDHKTYVRGFASGPRRLQKPQLSVDGHVRQGDIDADGSFEAYVQEPAAAKGKPWSIRLEVGTADGGYLTRTVPVDTCVEPPKGRIAGAPLEDVGAPYGAVVSPDKASTLEFAGAKLEIPAGAVTSDVRVTMRALDRGQVQPVEAEMNNVITGGGALRLGPHGLQFKKPVKVTLPIDAAQMPPGMNSGDVVAFFFDEGTRKWTQLPKVFSRSDRVVAETTHFTDFISSTIRTPDHPDAQKFNPNTMKGVKAGEPGAGITLIEPPEVNSRGTATLSYPIETPPARAGIGPSLALTYDSDRVNSNGWLGVGWDLQMSSVQIDTRFGAAKYDTSDVYLLDGQMLTPIATPTGAPAGGQYYQRRVEGPFGWIRRQVDTGSGPASANYVWTVTDKRGTVSTYGSAALNCGGASCKSRLANPNAGRTANIFRWYLEKVQDTFGNVMTIKYQHDTYSVGTAPNVETFDQIYPATIDYTSNGTTAAAYHVTFTVDGNLTSNPPTAGPRPDKVSNGRGGFLVQTRQRLAQIDVTSGTTLVRRYMFEYEKTAQDLVDRLQKSVLSAVAVRGGAGDAASELYRHSFEYNKAPPVDGMFSGQQTWGQTTQADDINHSNDDMGGGAVTLGYGFPGENATGSFGLDSGSSTPDREFFGITGEGLPSRVNADGSMSRNTIFQKLDSAQDHFAAGTLVGLPGFGDTSRSGWTVAGNVNYGVGGGSISYGRHVSEDNGLVTDIDGDGFPDVVFGGGSIQAYINDGRGNFTLKPWSGYDLSNSPFTTASRLADAKAQQGFFNTDPLVRWVAPFDGTVTVNSTVQRIFPGDTVGLTLKAELYVNNTLVNSAQSAWNDTTAHALATNFSQTVVAGDRIYLRAVALGDAVGHFNDGLPVTTNIAYTQASVTAKYGSNGSRSVSERDPLGFPIFAFNNQTDAEVVGMPLRTWHLTGNGDVGVARCFTKGVTSDAVKIAYVLRDKTGKKITHNPEWEMSIPGTTVATDASPSCFGNFTGFTTDTSNTLRAIIANVSPTSSPDQTLSLEVTSDTPIIPDTIDAKVSGTTLNIPVMAYTRYCRTAIGGAQACGTPQAASGGYTIVNGTPDPYTMFPIPANHIIGMMGEDDFHPNYSAQVWTVTNNGQTTPQPMRSKTTSTSGAATFTGSVTMSGTAAEDVTVLIQAINTTGTPNPRLLKSVKIKAGTAAGTFALTGPASNLATTDRVFFSIYSPTAAGRTGLTWNPTMKVGFGGTVTISQNDINKAIYDTRFDNNQRTNLADRDPMSGGFRRWFYGDWNHSVTPVGKAAGDFDDTLIVRVPTTTLPFNTDVVMSAIAVDPGSDDRYWQGRGGAKIFEDVTLIPGQVSTPVATATDASKMQSLRVADTWNLDLQAHIANVTGGANGGDSTTQVDFFDINGDHAPDSITNGGVQYNDPVHQTFSGRTSVPMSFSDNSDLRRTLNVSLQAGVGATGTRKLVNETKGNGKTNKVLATASINGSFDYGVNSTRVDFADVNGDGLVDHILEEPSTGQPSSGSSVRAVRVRLNLGYSFSNEVLWNSSTWDSSHDHTEMTIPQLPNPGGIADPVGAILNLVPGSPNSTNVLRLQDTGTLAASLGGNFGDVVGGGGGPTWSVTRKIVDLVDVNGDGLPDQVLKKPGDQHLVVKLNNGDSFAPAQQWKMDDWSPPVSWPTSAFFFMPPDGVEFSTLFGYGWNLSFQVCYFICFGMSGYDQKSNGGTSAQFEDINGDGMIDQVMKVAGGTQVFVKLNNIGQTNLLKGVTRPLGSHFDISYSRAGNRVDLDNAMGAVNMPSNHWVMATVNLDSAPSQTFNATITRNFDYSSPYSGNVEAFYDNVEREDYGFTHAKTIYPREVTGGTSVQSYFNNQNYYLHGLETIKLWNQDESNQIRLRETDFVYQDPTPGKDPNTQPAHTGSYFPALINIANFVNETGPSNKANYKLQTFDTSGNLTDVVDEGDDAGAAPFNYHIDYATPPPAPGITVPSAITVRTGGTAGQGFLLGQRIVPPNQFTPQGKPKQVTDVIAGGRNADAAGSARTATTPANATWTFTYDGFGNVQTATSPNDATTGDPDGAARVLTYTYEPTTQTYLASASWSDGTSTNGTANPALKSSSTYDLRFGLPKTMTDVAGATEGFDYDNYGRVTQIYAPSEFDAAGNRLATAVPTIDVSYSEMPHNATGFVETVPAYAMATHRSNAPVEGSLPTDALPNPLRTMRTVNFVDGLGRSIQVKKDMTLDDGTGTKTPGMSVSGQTIFDARGRVYQQGQPTFAGSAIPATSFVAVNLTQPSTFRYDMLSRLREEQHPDNGGQATTDISYALEVNPSDLTTYIVKTTTDPLYSADNTYHWRKEYQNTRGETIVRWEPNKINNAATAIVTTYGYDELGRLIRINDGPSDSPSTNTTSAEYDTVGNLVAVTSPDAGRREWFYCVGGYVCGEQSPIARAASTAGNAVRIKYTYDRDRLMRIDYPNPSTNPGVTYAYGTTAGGSTGDIGAAGFYRTGRVKTRTDETGTFAYQYDALGDVASETATLKNQIAGGSYSGYTTQYKWDNFGRLIDVIIPGTSRTTPPVSTPAETIRYGYDDGGAVTSARGLATGNSTPFEYVKHVGYNEFDEKVRITYGNNVFSTYGYAADTRRLTNANTTVQDAGGSRQTQALVYAYDLVGNVKTRTQNLPFDNVAGDAVLVGGTSTMSFTYDPLNQLIGSDLSMKTKQSERNFGSNYFTYDSIGNITEKNQTDGIEFQDSMGNTTGVQFLNYYDYKPSYGGTQFYDSPHAPSSISNIVLGQQQPPRNLAYDADGNLTSSLVNGSGRFLTWTDTDRVRSVCEGIQSNCNPTPATPMAKALYTADGTRTNNMVTQGTTTTETLYVNQNLTIRNGTLPTKHVYLGDTRIASKVETSASVWNQYYYHSDNLQSTQYVTTAGQTVVQHLEYFPSGDIWREQKGATPIDKIAHATAFTGKEMDAPSNYYYFGARYYEPQTQMWLSPDPILASYMKRGAAGGSPKNLDLYTYALNNPIVMRDSDGRWATAALAYYAASHRPPAAVNIEVWTEPVNDRSAGKKSYESGALKAWPRSMNYPRHTYIRVACDHCDPKLFPAEFQQPFDVRLEIQGPLVNDRAHGSATPFRHDPQNASSVQQLPWISNNYALQSPMASQYPPSPCGLAACLTNAYKTSAANLPIYGAQGPNSNTFANTVLEMCGVSTFFRKSEYGAYHQDEKHK